VEPHFRGGRQVEGGSRPGAGDRIAAGGDRAAVADDDPAVAHHARRAVRRDAGPTDGAPQIESHTGGVRARCRGSQPGAGGQGRDVPRDGAGSGHLRHGSRAAAAEVVYSPARNLRILGAMYSSTLRSSCPDSRVSRCAFGWVAANSAEYRAGTTSSCAPWKIKAGWRKSGKSYYLNPSSSR